MSDKNVIDESDPRNGDSLLRPLRPMGGIAEAVPARPTIRPLPGAKCEKCGCAQVSSQPFFSAGSGLAYRPISEDVRCHRCGHVGSPDYSP